MSVHTIRGTAICCRFPEIVAEALPGTPVRCFSAPPGSSTVHLSCIKTRLRFSLQCRCGRARATRWPPAATVMDRFVVRGSEPVGGKKTEWMRAVPAERGQKRRDHRTSAGARAQRHRGQFWRGSAASGGTRSSATVTSQTTAEHQAAVARLGKDQLAVYTAVLEERQSVFFTGDAGTGKSFLLRTIIDGLRCRFSDGRAVSVCASTGIAAANIGGTTIHSFAGVGFGDAPVEWLLSRISKEAGKRWNYTRVLVIDEISMLDGKFFGNSASL